MFEFKQKVYDVFTGYKGIITAIAHCYTGEIRYLVEALDSTGHPIQRWIDERRVKEVPPITRPIPFR